MLLEARSERPCGRVDHLKAHLGKMGKNQLLIWGSVGLLGACALPAALNPEVSPAPAPATQQAQTRETDAPLASAAIQHHVDISGCWRPVGSDPNYADGSSFTIFSIANNTFVIGKTARTSFVVTEDLRFIEGNRDPQKPFFPPGYIHSTGSVSADGLAISRKLVGDSNAREYRRCENVLEALPGMRQPVTAPEPTADPFATPSPEGTIAPLIPRSPLVTPEPTPSVAPSPQASATPQP